MSSDQKNTLRFSPPEPLRGQEPGSFAEHTLSIRLPGIARQVLQNNHWSDQIQGNLQDLIDEMPNGRLLLLDDPGAPDNSEWVRYMTPYLGMTWLQAPWFVVEMYFFRRILKAVGFFQQETGVDPYLVQKQAELPATLAAIQPLCEQFDPQNAGYPQTGEQKRDLLEQVLHTNIWGNQADLSIWSSSLGNQPVQPNEDQKSAFLLNDHTQTASSYLLSLEEDQIRVDFVLDNVGLELAHDLILTDYLLSSGISETVHYHLKPYPTYVSDATKKDVLDTLIFYKEQGSLSVQKMIKRLENNILEERLILVDHYFWVSPLIGWEMPSSLYQELSRSDLIISKGDANYRRWLGDRKWSADTPLEDSLNYLPAPMLALRVLKSEIVVGLEAGQALEMDNRDPEWMFNGRWGVIQFIS